MNWLHLMRLGIVATVFALGWMMRTITVPLLGAYLLMLICLPWRQRWKRRVGSTPATLLSMLALVVLPMALFLPAFAEADTLAAMLPEQDKAKEWTDKYIIPLLEIENDADPSSSGSESPDLEPAKGEPPLDGGSQNSSEEDFLPSLNQLLEKIRESDSLSSFATQLAKFVTTIGSTVVAFSGGVVGILSALFLLPIFLFYLLEGAPWLPRIRSEIPKSWRPAFDRTLPKIQNLLRVYCRARLLVALIKGAIAWLILLVFAVPGSYTLGLMVGVFSLLPVVGALLSTCAIILICMATHGWLGLVLAISVYAITELVEGYVLLPRLVGRELGMSDFVVILAVLGGGALMGFFGLLIAIPAVAICKVLYAEHLRPLMEDPVDAPESSQPPASS